jgi:magnesium transporter
MPEFAQKKKAEERLHILTNALEQGRLQHVWKMLNDLRPAEIAKLLESLRPAEREIIWKLVELENGGEILLHLNEEARAGLIRDMEDTDLVAAAEGMDMDDLADLLNDLPDAVNREVLRSMDNQNRQRLESVLSHPEDSAGGLMNTDTITIRADVTLDVVQRYLRLRGEIPPQTDSLIVVNRFDKYLGTLSLTKLLTSDPSVTVAEVMDFSQEGIPALLSAKEVANIFEVRDLVSAPVVDDDNKLLGRITIDDVVDVIRDEADHSLMSMAGLDEEDDMFAPVVASTRRRSIWLGVNLITAFLAAWVIGLFQATLEEVVALAVLMPISASMGGVAGMQTLTLVIRGLALGHIGSANSRWLMIKELAVGALNGLIWSIVVAAIAVAWFEDLRIGAFIAAAMLINLVCAALAGFAIPIVLRNRGIDPALAGSVVLTTITDVIGYMSFLGLATIFIL